MIKKYFQVFGNRILKELVVIVGNPNKHLFSPWNHLNKRSWCSMGHILLKNQMNILITPVQAIGHKILDLEISSQILQK